MTTVSVILHVSPIHTVDLQISYDFCFYIRNPSILHISQMATVSAILQPSPIHTVDLTISYGLIKYIDQSDNSSRFLFCFNTSSISRHLVGWSVENMKPYVIFQDVSVSQKNKKIIFKKCNKHLLHYISIVWLLQWFIWSQTKYIYIHLT